MTARGGGGVLAELTGTAGEGERVVRGGASAQQKPKNLFSSTPDGQSSAGHRSGGTSSAVSSTKKNQVKARTPDSEKKKKKSARLDIGRIQDRGMG